MAMNMDSSDNQNRDDGFPDMESLRLPQNYAEMISVAEQLTHVPVRKPGRQEFVRVHKADRIDLFLLELKEERESYIIRPEILPFLAAEASLVTLFRTINRQGVEFLWPVKRSIAEGRQNAWHSSAAAAAISAETDWTRVRADMDLGAYKVEKALGRLEEPAWRDVFLEQLMRIAFAGRVIDSEEHPVVRRLRGARLMSPGIAVVREAAGLCQLPFREIWAVDFEFDARPGSRPDPVCMVARELRLGRLVRWWRDQLHSAAGPPYPTDDPDSLLVAYSRARNWGVISRSDGVSRSMSSTCMRNMRSRRTGIAPAGAS
jgi:hypothetical protein